VSEATSASEDPERTEGTASEATSASEEPRTAAEELRRAAKELHAAVDSWHAVVEGVAAESDDDATEALADPRLEAAQDTFYERLAAFESAALPVLGLVALDDHGVPDGVEPDPTVDDFSIHLVVGAPDGAARDRLDEAMDLVDDAGNDLGGRLTAAGFRVIDLATTRGELALGDDDEDDEP
jgi:hypothetical protein